MRTLVATIPILILVSTLSVFGATPPALLNYQGVLRDASDRPLSGNYDMTFRFYDAATGVNEILVDAHTIAGASQVKVDGGLFNVQLGSGTVTDGSGAGVYTSLAEVFRDFSGVYLSIQVGAEILTPRVRIVAAGYALNAANLNGKAASNFLDTSATTQTKAGPLVCAAGVEGAGTNYGGYFRDSNSTGYGYVGYGDRGIAAFGNNEGGYFSDLDGSGYARVGYGDYGISALGNFAGGYMGDLDNSGGAYIGYGDRGIYSFGNTAGGYFVDNNDSGYAEVGTGDRGIQAYGNSTGGYFGDLDGTGFAYVGYHNYGIDAAGSSSGGHFRDSDSSGYASVGFGDYGIDARGNTAGGYFRDADGTGYANVGFGDRGISANGNASGGYFTDLDDSGYGYLGFGDYGLEVHGDAAGGYFDDLTSSAYARAAYDTYKVFGSGTVSFVQNHPFEKDKVIVYAAPEGDEVATYTRGTARLANGEARVSLGETFSWVTNPDLGLTAYVTPVGEWSDLFISSKSTRELIVKSHGGATDAVFDYIVYGLRIGFEELSIVQEKEIESFIPSMASHRQRYEQHPELRKFNSQERFSAMRERAGLASLSDSGAAALKAAIQEYDPAVHGPAEELLGHGGPKPEIQPRAAETPEILGQLTSEARDTAPIISTGQNTVTLVQTSERVGEETESQAVAGTLFPVSEPVEPGDVLTTDLDRPGWLRRAVIGSDPRVAGIAVGPEADGKAQVAVYGVTICKVDAGYGRIQPGDLLAASPTPGHAMRAVSTEAGTIIGKALDAFEAGTGTINILVMPR